MLLSVIIPALNEELYLPETLSRLRNNDSIDRTAEVADPACAGGSAAGHGTTGLHRSYCRVYPEAWRWLGIRLGMAQGAAQFCRKSAFTLPSGYDEAQFMGEEVDFQFLDDLKILRQERNQARFARSRVAIYGGREERLHPPGSASRSSERSSAWRKGGGGDYPPPAVTIPASRDREGRQL